LTLTKNSRPARRQLRARERKNSSLNTACQSSKVKSKAIKWTNYPPDRHNKRSSNSRWWGGIEKVRLLHRLWAKLSVGGPTKNINAS